MNLTIRAGYGTGKDGREEKTVKVKGISFGGREADMKKVEWLGDDEFTVRVPRGPKPGMSPLKVVREDGATSGKLDFRVLDSRPEVHSVYPDKVLLAAGRATDQKVITILGSRFGEPGKDGKAPEGAVLLGGRPLKVRSWRPERVEVYAPTEEEARVGGLDRGTGLDLEVHNASGMSSDPQTVVLLQRPDETEQMQSRRPTVTTGKRKE